MNPVSLYQSLVDLKTVLTPHGTDGLTIEGPAEIARPPLSFLIRKWKSELRAIALIVVEGNASTSHDSTWLANGPGSLLPKDHPLAVANERNWLHLEDRDRQYLLGRHLIPNPCVCCGGRYKHSRACEMMRSAGLGVVSSQRRRY